MALIVSGEKIDDSVIQKEVQRLRPDYERVFKDQSPEEREAQLLDWSKENVIEKVLINQYAEKHVKAISKKQLESAFALIKKQYQTQRPPTEKLTAKEEKKIKQDIKLQLKVERLLQDICKNLPPPTNEDVAGFYQKNKDRFKTEEQIRVAHIVRHVNWQTDEAAAFDAIKDIKDQLNKGASFEILAEKSSDCPDKGGDLGYIKKGQMVEEFEDVVFNLDIGRVSDIFRTRFGFHIAKLYDRKPSAFPGLEEVKTQIINELHEQMRRKAIDEFVDRLKEKALIEETF